MEVDQEIITKLKATRMKTVVTQKFVSAPRGLVSAIILAVSLTLGASALQAGVVPAHAKPHGKSYGDWVAAWWQWVMSIPADRNPLTDETGEFAGEDQQGKVWFVPGTFGGSAERSYTVPRGAMLFIPVYNWIFGSGVFDCDPTVPGMPCDVDDLRAAAAANTEAAEFLSVTIDGASVENLRSYRAAPPQPFPITYPENSVTGVPAGTYYPQVADGYWLMLTPLSKGQHTIVVQAKASDTLVGPIEFTVIHHITVQ
jgi:hypothetical protein